MTTVTQRIFAAALAIVTLLATAHAATAQIEIKAGDDVNLKLGILGQFQADTLDNPVTDTNTNNLFVRRLRLMFGGQVAKNITFFVETDAPNLGKTLSPAGKNIQPSIILQDAYAEIKIADAFAIDAGLMFVPFSRNSVQSAATLLPVDYGPYTFSQSTPTQSATGRDTGFQAKGYMMADHLEYRVGAFQGVRDPTSDNAFRYAGRLQYNVFDTETDFFYAGTYLGKKKILAVGGAFDVQDRYHGYDADLFADMPAGPGAFTGQLAYNHFDGGTSVASLPAQHDILLEIGYLISALKLTPVVQFSTRDVADTTTGDENHWSVGLNYWWAGHNANLKGAYTRIDPSGRAGQNELTVQLQLFYF